jgi:tetratricopeptide (TPR) repeat protein
MSDYQVWNELGNVYIISNEPDKAVNAYRKALDLNPESGRTHNNIALAYIRLSQPEKAIEHYQRSIELFKSFADKAEAWHRLGNAYQMLGDTKNTLLAFERATALAPERAEYQNSLTAMLEMHLEAPKEPNFTETAPRKNNDIPAMDPELKKQLIPLAEEVEDQEENIDLDPGVEALMNELSREIECEVDVKAPEMLSELSPASEDVSHLDVETTVTPKWLADEDDEVSDHTETETEEDLLEETVSLDESEPVTYEDEIGDSEVISDEAEEEKVAEELPNFLASVKNLDEDEVIEEIEEDDDFEDDEDEDYDLADEDEYEDEDEDEDLDDEEDFDDDDLIEEFNPAINPQLPTTEDVKAENQTDTLMHNASIWGEMGNVFYSSDAYDGAAIAYHKALEIDGNYGAVMHNLAMLHMQRGEYDQAVELYQKSIDALQDPAAQASSWNNLGHAYRALRDYENAKEAYRKADELDAEHVVPKNWKCNELLSTKPV